MIHSLGRIFLERFIITQLITSSEFMELDYYCDKTAIGLHIEPVQFKPPHLIYERPILILSSHLRLIALPYGVSSARVTNEVYPSSTCRCFVYEVVSKSFRTYRLERELQMVQFSATRCSCIAIL